MEELIPLAEKAKVKLLIQNEESQNVGTSAEVKAIMELLPSKTIGFNWDPGDAQSLKRTLARWLRATAEKPHDERPVQRHRTFWTARTS